MIGKLAALMTAVITIGLLLGLLVRPLFAPWALASAIFVLNYGMSLPFMPLIGRLNAAAAAGIAVISFLIRFGLIGLGLLLVALALPQYFVSTAICFLAVYTVFLGLEIFVGLKGRAGFGQEVKRERAA